MPINVFKITKGKKNRPTLTPGIGLSKSGGVGIGASPKINGISIIESSTHYRFDKDIYQKTTSVYTTNDIDLKISKLNDSIELAKKYTDTEISKSLSKIQTGLKDLKKDILNSKSLKEQIKAEIIEELKNEVK
jgi:hypothetical protein